jgi:Alpha/beta hydrolase
MTLTLAEIEVWDDAAIDQVFAAATSRAEGAQTTGDAVGDLLTFVKWDGATAEAARDSASRIKVTLSDHADQCSKVAAAAKKATAEVADLKYRLSTIKADAEEAFLSIDEQAGTLTRKTAVLTVSQLDHQKAVMHNLAGRINQLLADADGVDRDLATAIEAADGAAGAADGAGPAGPAPNLPKPPPTSASPAGVKKWWDGLTPQQQTDYIVDDPAAIDRDGIPIGVRDAGNRIRLPHELAAAKRTLDQATENERADAQARYNDLLGIQNALYPTNPNGTPKTVNQNDRRSLILLDAQSNPRQVFGAIGIGDVDRAAHVGVTVSGVGTNAASLPGMADEATTLRHTTSDILRQAGDANPDSVATIAWVGYEPPATLSDLRVVSDGLARAAAPHLNSLFNGLGVTTENPHQDITAFGHSYGSLVTSLALQGGTPVKNAVFYGSPGLELAHASDLHLAAGGHAYYEQAADDPIDWVQREPYLLPVISPLPGLLADWFLGSGDHLQRFGDTPNEMPDITQLSTSPGADPMHIDEHRAGAQGHSEYARGDGNGNLRMSGYNLAAVLSGVPGAPKTGN